MLPIQTSPPKEPRPKPRPQDPRTPTTATMRRRRSAPARARASAPSYVRDFASLDAAARVANCAWACRRRFNRVTSGPELARRMRLHSCSLHRPNAACWRSSQWWARARSRIEENATAAAAMGQRGRTGAAAGAGTCRCCTTAFELLLLPREGAPVRRKRSDRSRLSLGGSSCGWIADRAPWADLITCASCAPCQPAVHGVCLTTSAAGRKVWTSGSLKHPSKSCPWSATSCANCG